MTASALWLAYAVLATCAVLFMASYPTPGPEEIGGVWRGIGLIWIACVALGLLRWRSASPRQWTATAAAICVVVFWLGYFNSRTAGGDLPWLFLLPSGPTAIFFLVRLWWRRWIP